MTLHKVTQNDTFCTLSREDIIALVQEAIIENPNDNPFDFRLSSIEAVERFASLVAAHEREACAKMCEELFQTTPPYAPYVEAAQDCADAIRARGGE